MQMLGIMHQVVIHAPQPSRIMYIPTGMEMFSAGIIMATGKTVQTGNGSSNPETGIHRTGNR